MFTVADRSALHEQIADAIAESRYQAWDGHAASGITWEAYAAGSPNAASVYIEDGSRDADKVIEHVITALEHYGVVVEPTAEESAAAESYDDGEPSAEELNELTAELADLGILCDDGPMVGAGL